LYIEREIWRDRERNMERQREKGRKRRKIDGETQRQPEEDKRGWVKARRPSSFS
jgi:hypothetical protein